MRKIFLPLLLLIFLVAGCGGEFDDNNGMGHGKYIEDVFTSV